MKLLYRVVQISCCVLLINTHASAQQDPVFGQYMFNMLSINPAYAGQREVLSATALYRRQWTAVKGSPTTELLSVDCGFPNKKVGVGLQIFNDNLGVINNSGVSGSYAYRLHLRHGVLSMGLQMGISRFKGDYSNLQLYNYQDPAFSSNQNLFHINMGTGLFYHTDRFYAGLSVPRLTVNSVTVRSENGLPLSSTSSPIFLTTGYAFKISNEFVLKPSVLLRMSSGAPVHADLNANLWLMDIVSLGFSYRTSEAAVAMFEFQPTKQFRFGYAYDYNFNLLGKQNTNEIMLRYEFGYNKKAVMSPRYF